MVQATTCFFFVDLTTEFLGPTRWEFSFCSWQLDHIGWGGGVRDLFVIRVAKVCRSKSISRCFFPSLYARWKYGVFNFPWLGFTFFAISISFFLIFLFLILFDLFVFFFNIVSRFLFNFLVFFVFVHLSLFSCLFALHSFGSDVTICTKVSSWPTDVAFQHLLLMPDTNLMSSHNLGNFPVIFTWTRKFPLQRERSLRSTFLPKNSSFISDTGVANALIEFFKTSNGIPIGTLMKRKVEWSEPPRILQIHWRLPYFREYSFLVPNLSRLKTSSLVLTLTVVSPGLYPCSLRISVLWSPNSWKIKSATTSEPNLASSSVAWKSRIKAGNFRSRQDWTNF